MAHSRFFLFAVASIVATWGAVATIAVQAAESIARFGLYLIKTVALQTAAPRFALETGDIAGECWADHASPRVDRHEAGMSRRAAPRHT